MAYYKFTHSYFAGLPIRLFNAGDTDHDLLRDFTYIDDVVESVVRLFDSPPSAPDPHRILNVGNSSPVALMTFVRDLEDALGKALGRQVSFTKEFVELQAGDVPSTFASTVQLEQLTGYRPAYSAPGRVEHFASWYVDYHGHQDD